MDSIAIKAGGQQKDDRNACLKIELVIESNHDGRDEALKRPHLN